MKPSADLHHNSAGWLDAVDEAIGLADTIINRLPANGEHWSLIQRYCAARSAMDAAPSQEGASEGEG